MRRASCSISSSRGRGPRPFRPHSVCARQAAGENGALDSTMSPACRTVQPFTDRRKVEPMHPPRNPIGWRQRIQRLQSSAIQFDLRAYDSGLERIAELEPELARSTDAQLKTQAGDLRARARTGESLATLR